MDNNKVEELVKEIKLDYNELNEKDINKIISSLIMR
jgi:uncharacterized protein (DUF433 family)